MEPQKNMTSITSCDRLLYSRAEAAQLLGICLSTLDALVRSKKLKARFIGDSPRFSRTELERFAGVRG